MTKSIVLDEDVYNSLLKLKKENETYTQVIWRLKKQERLDYHKYGKTTQITSKMEYVVDPISDFYTFTLRG